VDVLRDVKEINFFGTLGGAIWCLVPISGT